ncbi:MAG: 8-oxo-dGTP diphosphatase [Actinomycetota bacterium]|jgi:ADP-ribose pyrophosphatase YjhB (NUDIX family)
MNRPEICVGAVVVDEDRLLMIRRGHGPGAGEWSIPGGRVERGETLIEALVREVFEETHIEVVVDHFIGFAESITDEFHFVFMDYAATALDAEVIAAGDDAAEAAWVLLADVVELNLVDGLAEFLHDHQIIEAFA